MNDVDLRELEVLRAEVAALRTELAALYDHLAREVRTQRLVVVDRSGHERVTAQVDEHGTLAEVWVGLSSGTGVSMAVVGDHDGDELAELSLWVDGDRLSAYSAGSRMRIGHACLEFEEPGVGPTVRMDGREVSVLRGLPSS